MKKKILGKILVFMVFILVLLFQLLVVNNNYLFGVKPNLILIFLIVYSMFSNMYKTCLVSFLIGLLMDVVAGNGNSMFLVIYSFVGIIISIINQKYTKENKITIIALCTISVIGFEIIEGIMFAILNDIYPNVFVLFKQIIISIMLNLILSEIVYGIINSINETLDLKFKQHIRGL